MKLGKAIKALVPDVAPVVVWATVTNVSAEKETCTVDVDGIMYEDVPLSGFGMCVIPTEGSAALVAEIENTAHIAFLAFTEIEALKINAETVKFQGGENGGLLIVNSVVSKLNALEQTVNQLKDILKNWVPTPNDGGAALKTAASAWAAQPLVETKNEDVENQSILQ